MEKTVLSRDLETLVRGDKYQVPGVVCPGCRTRTLVVWCDDERHPTFEITSVWNPETKEYEENRWQPTFPAYLEVPLAKRETIDKARLKARREANPVVIVNDRRFCPGCECHAYREICQRCGEKMMNQEQFNFECLQSQSRRANGETKTAKIKRKVDTVRGQKRRERVSRRAVRAR